MNASACTMAPAALSVAAPLVVVRGVVAVDTAFAVLVAAAGAAVADVGCVGRGAAVVPPRRVPESASTNARSNASASTLAPSTAASSPRRGVQRALPIREEPPYGTVSGAAGAWRTSVAGGPSAAGTPAATGYGSVSGASSEEASSRASSVAEAGRLSARNARQLVRSAPSAAG